MYMHPPVQLPSIACVQLKKTTKKLKLEMPLIVEIQPCMRQTKS